MRRLLLCALIGCICLHAKVDPLEGLWQGYDGEWGHVSRQLVALAEAIPASKYAWRPAPGVRSTSEVFMHIALTNFWLLSITGVPMPADIKSPDMERAVTAKADVIEWLKRSLDAVKKARASLKPKGQGGGSGCDGSWHVFTDHRPFERTYGPVGSIRPGERRCTALVKSCLEVAAAADLNSADLCDWRFRTRLRNCCRRHSSAPSRHSAN
jgi:hypothetical protein